MLAGSHPANPQLLHRVLGYGLFVMSAVAAFGKVFGVVPLLPQNDFIAKMAYVFIGIVAALVAVAFVVLKPRVPERRPGQSVDAYWSTPDVVTKIMTVWFLMEGGGVMGIVGYGITGEPLVALVGAIAIAAFWLCGPNVFAKA